MNIKKSMTALIAAGLMMGTVPAMADGAALYVSKTCASCHGADGKSPIMPLYPKLAGQNKEYTIQQMKDIKSGARNNGQTIAMKAIMAMVSDAEIEQIAAWLETQ